MLSLKYVPRKYKLDNDQFSCSGETSTETKETARGVRELESEPATNATVFTLSAAFHLAAPRRTPPVEAAPLYWKNDTVV